MKALAFAALLFAHAAVADDFQELKARADQDEASLTDAQEAALLDTQGKVAYPTFADCSASSLEDRRLPFTVVMQLGADGRVQQTWREGNSEIALCLERAMREATLFVPPRSPFYSSFEYRLEP